MYTISFVAAVIAASAAFAAVFLVLQVQPRQRSSGRTIATDKAFTTASVFTVTSNDTVILAERNRSTLVLHSGPHKMGTTYLQCALQSSLAATYLKQDGYVYLGKRNDVCDGHGDEFGNVAHIMVPGSQLHVQQRFIDTMSRLHKDGMNAIIVTESWHPLRDSQYRAIAAALAENWTVQHVVAYRPIYDWIPSYYSERFRPLYTPRYNWTGSGTKTWAVIPAATYDPSDTWSYGLYNMLKFLRAHPTRLVMDRVTRLLPGRSSSVIDMTNISHDPDAVGDDYLIQMLCREIKDATNTCHAARTVATLSVVKKANPSYYVDADRLASAALQQGLISTKTDRTTITKRTNDRLANLTKSLNFTPNSIRVCPSKQSLSMLMALSLELEEQVFDRISTKEQEQRHMAGFQKAVESGRLCALDTGKLLQDPSWVAFFHSLRA